MTFMDLYKKGMCPVTAIDLWVKEWHQGDAHGQSLREYLGLDDEEYRVWLTHGNRGLAAHIRSGHIPEYSVIHYGWDELSSLLQGIADTELGPGYTVKLLRRDFYFWDMILRAEKEVTEEESMNICERLDLRDVDSLMFVYDDQIDSGYLCGLLSKLVHRDAVSSHADEDGVWIVSRAVIDSSPKFTAHLISECERRLEKEIRSKNYSLVNQDTACHQLFGFMEALCKLGMLDREKWYVMPDHFKDVEPAARIVP